MAGARSHAATRRRSRIDEAGHSNRRYAVLFINRTNLMERVLILRRGRCQHFSGRSINDRCSTLWASWAVVQEEKKGLKGGSVWFGGDTGFKSGQSIAILAVDLLTIRIQSHEAL